ncbi:MAG: hypothetical protein EOP37_00720 [Rubrivivax sp.]|nr:MAG: hypothetical protein EOP37_00720 [Rubrivivax sp.]
MTTTARRQARAMARTCQAVLAALMLLVAMLTGTSAWAARDDGQWQILNARYGTSQRNMDVTGTLKELARRDDRVRVTNELFGNDPAHGQTKTLRIYARNRNGDNRTFEFREGSVIDGNDFTGWRGGDWGHGGGSGSWEGGGGHDDGAYAILGARYGAAEGSIDVTGRLRELARRDAKVRVTNDLFRDDPAVGRTKTLRIYARDRSGQVRTFDYREGSWIDGGQFTGWGRGDWGQGGWNGGWDGRPGSPTNPGGYNPGGQGPAQDQRLNIVRATYGNGGRFVDVTDRLRNISRGGRLDIRVDNDLVGRDPAHGETKTLRVYYTLGRGKEQMREAREGDRLRLP